MLTSVCPESKKLLTHGRGVLIVQLRILSHAKDNPISLPFSTTKLFLPGMMSNLTIWLLLLWIMVLHLTAFCVLERCHSRGKATSFASEKLKFINNRTKLWFATCKIFKWQFSHSAQHRFKTYEQQFKNSVLSEILSLQKTSRFQWTIKKKKVTNKRPK